MTSSSSRFFIVRICLLNSVVISKLIPPKAIISRPNLFPQIAIVKFIIWVRKAPKTELPVKYATSPDVAYKSYR